MTVSQSFGLGVETLFGARDRILLLYGLRLKAFSLCPRCALSVREVGSVKAYLRNI
jgi:hypothetical protein